MERADVIIIGTGQAGAPLSWRLAREGRRVVVFERGDVGGTCVNEGCTPTKTFIASAYAAHWARKAPSLGVRTGDVRVDLAAVVARKDRIVGEWRSGVEGGIAKAGDGLTLVRAHAHFTGPSVVEADGTSYTADVMILNTGARARVPELPGIDEVPFLDNRTVMELTELPDHLVVMGGGYIGCEFGQAYRRLGARVTLVQSHEHLIPREDEDVSGALEDAFRDEGIEMRLGVRAVGVRHLRGGLAVDLDDGGKVEGTHLLVAVGRVPNTDGLGCAKAGIALDAHGNVVVDDHYRTSAKGVYAVGDCTGGPQFTHTSWDDHRILFDLLHGEERRTRADRLVPHASFTDPQVARVGLSEREARATGVAYEVAVMPFGRIARAYETAQTAGLVKVLLDPETERILGAAVVGAEGAELVSVYQMLMMADAPARAIVDAEMIHPAFAEGLQTAVMRFERYRLS